MKRLTVNVGKRPRKKRRRKKHLRERYASVQIQKSDEEEFNLINVDNNYMSDNE